MNIIGGILWIQYSPDTKTRGMHKKMVGQSFLIQKDFKKKSLQKHTQ